jgi:hypothetical protein
MMTLKTGYATQIGSIWLFDTIPREHDDKSLGFVRQTQYVFHIIALESSLKTVYDDYLPDLIGVFNSTQTSTY